MTSGIAEPDGSIEWLTEFPNPEKMDYGFKALLTSVDTVLMGGRTYREFLNMDIIWTYPQQMTYVVSRHNWGEKENVHFITENVVETISELRHNKGKDILLVGGGELTSMLIAADLEDEMQIIYIPVILGKGISFFTEQPKESKWELTKSENYTSSIVMVEYQKTNLSRK